MIEFQNICKKYQQNGQTIQALNEINLAIPKGSIYGVIGYSGAGKSTLIRLINLLERPTQGKIIIHGQDFTALSSAQLRKERTKIGMIFQHFNLLNSRTVAENIEMPMHLLGIDKNKRQARLTELLDFIGLKHKKDAYPDELSGGQKQRVGIARALANHPTILLCDEATSALDPQTTQSVLDLLKKINQEQGITIVMVTHEMDVIAKVCDHVAMMENGQVIESGRTIDLFHQPQHETTKRFIQTIFQQHLPQAVQQQLHIHDLKHVYRLQFRGALVGRPIVQHLIQHFDLDMNILFSNMVEVGDTLIGQIFASIQGDETKITSALAYLAEQEIMTSQVEQNR